MTEAEKYLIKEYKELIDTLGITDVSENKLFTWEDTINLMNQYTRHIAEQAVEYEKKTWLGDNSGLINRTSENILNRINKLTQGE